jgi:hypothetical protein
MTLASSSSSTTNSVWCHNEQRQHRRNMRPHASQQLKLVRLLVGQHSALKRHQ